MSAGSVNANDIFTSYLDIGGVGGEGAGDGVISGADEIANFNSLVGDENAFNAADADGDGVVS